MYKLVYNDQLYDSREEAAAARTATGRPELFDITEYTIDELEKVYMSEIYIHKNLKVQCVQW